MYKCTCNIDINPLKFPNHLKSKRHKYFYNKININHPFYTKEPVNINNNELFK